MLGLPGEFLAEKLVPLKAQRNMREKSVIEKCVKKAWKEIISFNQPWYDVDDTIDPKYSHTRLISHLNMVILRWQIII